MSNNKIEFQRHKFIKKAILTNYQGSVSNNLIFGNPNLLECILCKILIEDKNYDNFRTDMENIYKEIFTKKSEDKSLSDDDKIEFLNNFFKYDMDNQVIKTGSFIPYLTILQTQQDSLLMIVELRNLFENCGKEDVNNKTVNLLKKYFTYESEFNPSKDYEPKLENLTKVINDYFKKMMTIYLDGGFLTDKHARENMDIVNKFMREVSEENDFDLIADEFSERMNSSDIDVYLLARFQRDKNRSLDGALFSMKPSDLVNERQIEISDILKKCMSKLPNIDEKVKKFDDIFIQEITHQYIGLRDECKKYIGKIAKEIIDLYQRKQWSDIRNHVYGYISPDDFLPKKTLDLNLSSFANIRQNIQSSYQYLLEDTEYYNVLYNCAELMVDSWYNLLFNILVKSFVLSDKKMLPTASDLINIIECAISYNVLPLTREICINKLKKNVFFKKAGKKDIIEFLNTCNIDYNAALNIQIVGHQTLDRFLYTNIMLFRFHLSCHANILMAGIVGEKDEEIKEITDKIKEYEKGISVDTYNKEQVKKLSSENHKIETENKKLSENIESLEDEIIFLKDKIKNLEMKVLDEEKELKNENTYITNEQIQELCNKHKIVFVGGHSNMISMINERIPNLYALVSMEDYLHLKPEQVKNCDYVFTHTKHASHKMYRYTKELCERYNKPLIHVNINNLDLIILQIFNTITKETQKLAEEQVLKSAT